MDEAKTRHKEHVQRLPTGPKSTWGDSSRRVPREELYKVPEESTKEIFYSIY